ncbi:RHS repeat-associated core domain-containing protein [Xanthomarina gelatinilytica]|uniref:RHS repeat-associated core domain-containing protein n=1 Tax=Xanthomarina gelatinilytica TaxID=1137281 RepID=UPI003AA839E0
MKNLAYIFLLFGVIVYGQEPAPSASSNLNKNWVSSINYNIYGETIAKSISFFNDGGKPIENQRWDKKNNKIWTSKTFYDQYNRVALNTFEAPQNNFGLNSSFILDELGGNFNNIDYDLPNTVESPSIVNTSSLLGAYFSNNNTDNPYQDITSYPYIKNVYSTLNPEKVLRVLGSNKLDGEWKNSYSFTMPVSLELSQDVAFDDGAYDINSSKAFKTVTRDIHGVETVIFSDLEGNILANARSGNEESGSSFYRQMAISVSEQLYVDIHIPVGLSGITVYTQNPGEFVLKIYDLISEEIIHSESMLSESLELPDLPSGIYRMFFKAGNSSYIYDSDNPIQVLYKENYYDYALNYYDGANRLVSTKQPLNHLETTYKYDSAGRIIETVSVDEGTAKFKYRKDGQIRYSQNSKQLNLGEFSYTNYDNLGRPIESGVISGSFTSANPNNALPSGTKKEQQFTEYDFIHTGELSALGIHAEYHSPTFLEGNVAKTSNTQSTTYYSYDIYGRTKWVVQNINGLGVKTINYEYDNGKNVVAKVIYQKHTANELFIHRYTYDVDNTLTKVETSKNGTNFIKKAAYEYYENKTLKRIELGNNIQGIDYVYNINGQLKAINHPSLDATKDPGGDDNDVFGMTLDYYSGDYQRLADFQTPNIADNVNQFNGNISGATWNVGPFFNQDPVQYRYQYNKNNWLSQADFYSEPSSGYGATDYDVSNITYDANGNIQSLKRNKNTQSSSNAMDDLSYVYDANKPNQLKQVQDAVTVPTFANDIKNQSSANNYQYNEIGQLEKNLEENLDYLYNASGLVTEVKKNGTTMVKFYYNDRNHRVKKESFTPSGVSTTHYVRDLSGNPISIYYNNTLTEHPVYGSNRIGVYYREANQDTYQVTDHLGNVRAVLMETESQGIVFSNDFEETLSPWIANDKATSVTLEGGMMRVVSKEHLGGVDGTFEFKEGEYIISMDVIKPNFKEPLEFSVWKKDKLYYSELIKDGRLNTKLSIKESGKYRINFRLNNKNYIGQDISFYLDNFEIVITNTMLLSMTNKTDYYPGGMAMPGRNIVGDYRYDWQGQELDRETGKHAFELRLYDSRINRWLTTDPAGQFHSPYLGMGNNPVAVRDPDGGFACIDVEGNPIPCPEGYGSYDAIMTTKDAYFDENMNFSFEANALDLVDLGTIQEARVNSSLWPAILGTSATLMDDNLERILINRGNYIFSRADLPKPLPSQVNVRTPFGSIGTTGKTLDKIATGARYLGWGIGVYNGISLENQRQNGEIGGATYFVEQGTNLFGTLGGIYGLSWSIGWEAGKRHGQILHHIPFYTEFKTSFRETMGLPNN